VKIQKVFIPFVISTIKKLNVKLGENGNMKANRKFVEGEEAVSAVIGVILMVAITVAIAATVYVYVSGMLGSGPETNPTVSLQQTGSYVSIIEVQNGPVTGSEATAVFVNQTSGASTAATITYTNGNAANVDGGDIIVKPGVATLNGGEELDIGDKFTVQILYGGDVIGTCVFTIQV